VGIRSPICLIRIYLGSGIIAAIVNATIGALILFVIIKLVRGLERAKTGEAVRIFFGVGVRTSPRRST
jgi:large-conductance mechanosensitive channel